MPDSDSNGISTPNAETTSDTRYSPPSLTLSMPINGNISTGEKTPSAVDNKWRHSVPSPMKQAPLNDSLGQDLSSLNSNYRVDEFGMLNHTSHSRGSSNASNSSIPYLNEQAHLSGGLDAVMSALASERPHSFSGGISQSDLRRLQNLPTKGQPPSPISTLSRLEGPKTSLPQDKSGVDIWQDQIVSAGPTHTPPQFPSLGEQPTAFPSIQQAGGEVMMNHRGTVPPPLNIRHDQMLGNEDFQASQRMQLRHAGLQQAPRGAELHGRNVPSRQVQLTQYGQQMGMPMMPSAVSPYSPQSQGRPSGLDRSVPAFAPSQQAYYDLLQSPPPVRRDGQLLVQRGAPVPASPLPIYAGAQVTPPSDFNGINNAQSLAMLNGLSGINPYGGMPMAANGMYSPPPNGASPITASFATFAPTNSPQYYQQSNNFIDNESLANVMGRMTLSPSYPPGNTAYSDTDSQATSPSGPSANNRKLGLYKTELCRSWEEKGSCRYGAKCQFAHSETEVRRVSRHPKYKTEICRTFWVSGSCPYGKRCCFIHTELPPGGTAPGADGSSPPKLSNVGNPENPMATGNTQQQPTSGANGEVQQISLLQRISAQRDAAALNLNSPGDVRSPGSYQFAKPSNTSLRLDTSSLPKTNYPLTSNPTLMSSEQHQNAISPIMPATAGPDFGRQATARAEVVGYNIANDVQRALSSSKTHRDSQLRHSFNGTEVGLSINSPESPASGLPAVTFSVTPDSANQTPTSAVNHQRSGSAGQWPTGSLNSRSPNVSQMISPGGFMSNNGNGESGNPWGGGLVETTNVNRKRLSGTWL